MSQWVSELADAMLRHLVAIGFSVFILVGIVWREPLFFSAEHSQAEAQAVAISTEVRPTFAPEIKTAEARVEPRMLPEAQQAVALEGEADDQPVSDEVSGQTLNRPSDLSADQAPAESLAQPPAGQKLDLAEMTTEPQVPDEREAAPSAGEESAAASGEAVVSAEEDPATSLVLSPLQAARAAFWQRQWGSAERWYLEHLAQFPNDAAAFEELGNFYQAAGQSHRALDAYYQAGLRFRQQNDRAAVQKLAERLYRAGDPRAEWLGH